MAFGSLLPRTNRSFLVAKCLRQVRNRRKKMRMEESFPWICFLSYLVISYLYTYPWSSLSISFRKDPKIEHLRSIQSPSTCSWARNLGSANSKELPTIHHGALNKEAAAGNTRVSKQKESGIKALENWSWRVCCDARFALKRRKHGIFSPFATSTRRKDMRRSWWSWWFVIQLNCFEIVLNWFCQTTESRFREDITGGCESRCSFQLPYAEERGHHLCEAEVGSRSRGRWFLIDQGNVLILVLDTFGVWCSEIRCVDDFLYMATLKCQTESSRSLTWLLSFYFSASATESQFTDLDPANDVFVQYLACKQLRLWTLQKLLHKISGASLSQQCRFWAIFLQAEQVSLANSFDLRVKAWLWQWWSSFLVNPVQYTELLTPGFFIGGGLRKSKNLCFDGTSFPWGNRQSFLPVFPEWFFQKHKK